MTNFRTKFLEYMQNFQIDCIDKQAKQVVQNRAWFFLSWPIRQKVLEQIVNPLENWVGENFLG